MSVLSIQVPIWKKSGNLFNDPRIYIYSIRKFLGKSEGLLCNHNLIFKNVVYFSTVLFTMFLFIYIFLFILFVSFNSRFFFCRDSFQFFPFLSFFLYAPLLVSFLPSFIHSFFLRFFVFSFLSFTSSFYFLIWF